MTIPDNQELMAVFEIDAFDSHIGFSVQVDCIASAADDSFLSVTACKDEPVVVGTAVVHWRYKGRINAASQDNRVTRHCMPVC